MRIKRKYKCNFCNKKSTAEKWNKATLEQFPGDSGVNMLEMVGDDSLGSVCPKCESINLGNEIEVIENKIDNLSIFDIKRVKKIKCI